MASSSDFGLARRSVSPRGLFANLEHDDSGCGYARIMLFLNTDISIW